MPNGTLHRRAVGGWNPSADANNAPQGALLRADNLQLDELGALALRKGSAKVNADPYTDLDVHSLGSFNLGGTRYRMAAAAADVYANGVSLGLTMAGSGDVAMHSHLGQVFMARSTSKHKYDGATVRTWGLPAPTTAPLVTAVDLTSKYFATCASGESPAFTAGEGTITTTYPTGEDGTANGAIEVTPDSATGRAAISRILSAGTDYLVLGSAIGGVNDAFSMAVYFSNPEEVEFVQILISCIGDNTVTDYFATDYYTYKWVPNEERAMALTAQEIVAEMTNEAMAEAALALGYTPEEAKAAAKKGVLSAEVQARIKEDSESLQGVTVLKLNAATWQRLTIPRAAFSRVGSTAGCDWRTIKGITLVYKAKVGSASTCRFDSVKIVSADGSRLLTGRYRFCYRYARQFDGYKAVGPVSPPSAEVLLSAQGARLTLPAGTTTGLDDQVDTIEAFVYGGLLDKYYRCGAAYIGLDTNPRSMRIDEFDRAPDGAVSTPDRIRGTAFWIFPGFQPGYLDYHAGETYSWNVYASELSLLIANEPLDLQDTTPPDNIVDIEGPYYERILCLTSKYLYPSRRRNPDTFCLAHAIPVTSGIDEVAYWCRKAAGGVYIGTSADIYRLEGSFEELPGNLLNLRRVPLCVGNPPVSSEVVQEGGAIIYRAGDGFRFFHGETTVSLNGALNRLFVEARHGVSQINTGTGRFRMALARGVLSVVVPEGTSTTYSPVIYRLRLSDGLWYRHTYGSTNWRSITAEPDGTLLAGDTAGTVWVLDSGDHDGTAHIPVVLWTPVEDDEMPLARKEPYDIQALLDTGGETASIALHLDGSGTAATALSAATSGAQMYREDLADTLSPAIGWQLRVTGSFSTFRWCHWTLSYRYHPQHRLFLDWLPDVGTRYAWARFIRLKAILFNSVQVSVYNGDTLLETHTISDYTSGVLDVFRVRLGREVKGRQLRVQLTAVNATSVGDVGFEPYYLEMVYRGSGTTTEKATRLAIMPAERIGGGQEPS